MHTVEYYSATKMNDVLIHDAKMNLSNMLSKSQSQKATYPRRPRINKSIETETRYWFPETGKRGEWGVSPVVDNENALELGAGDGYTILQIPKSTELDTIRG